jgi:hypothetical protein
VKRVRRLLKQDLDWAYLLRAALAHGVAPLLYWHLNATCPQAVPRELLDSLRDHFSRTLRHNLFLTGELLRLLDLFAAHGIRAVPFKGPAVAAALYGNLALRQFGDLDILVGCQDVLRARDLLEARGYRPLVPLNEAWRTAFILRHLHALGFTHEHSNTLVEVHWELMPRWWPFPLSLDRLWERLGRVSVGGKSVSTLSPADTLLVGCAHGCKHVWQSLGWLCDIAEWLRAHDGVSWEPILEQARDLGSERMLLLGLRLASDLLGPDLPGSVAHRVLANGTVGALARQVRRQLFQGKGGAPGLLATSLFHLRVRDRVGDRVQYCLRGALVPNEADWDFLPLPPRLHFLYPLLRPVRLLCRYPP